MVAFRTADQLVWVLKSKPDSDATKGLARFYAQARFGIGDASFDAQFTDGPDDDGVDFWNIQDGTYSVIQSKFSRRPKGLSSAEVKREITKLLNAISGQEHNVRARTLFDSVRADLGNQTRFLEYIFLTTNLSSEAQRESLADWVAEQRTTRGWSLQVDLVLVDKPALNMVCYDVEHGFVPHTGRVELRFQSEGRIEHLARDTNIYSVVGTVKIADMLRILRSPNIESYLEKNVRGFRGDNKVNKSIRASYQSGPDYFWFKHNGIIIFADAVNPDWPAEKLVLRNPQIVNGGQTIRTLYSAFLRDHRRDNGSTILVRVYRLPYDDSNTYRKSIDVIKALNYQNKILDSDLKSNDQRQVRIEQLMRELSLTYVRKQSRAIRAALDHVLMRDLGMRYLLCKRRAASIGVAGAVESVFANDNLYDEVFPPREIERDFGMDHIAIRYATTWIVDRYLQRMALPWHSAQYQKFTKFFVLGEAAPEAWKFGSRKFTDPIEWVDFLRSHAFTSRFGFYSKRAFARARQILPPAEEAIDFYKTDRADSRFASRRGRALINDQMRKALRAYSA